jgi:Domain of unknown function (DUF4419)
MNSPTSTFEVSRVSRATEPLSEVPYHQAIDHLLCQPLLNMKRRLQGRIGLLERFEADEQDEHEGWMTGIKRQLAAVETDEAAQTRPIEACSCSHGRLVADVLAHPVLAALYRAFMQHRPLCLSPDMIWLLLCQGVAHHINVHTEDLRPRFVRHQGKARIEVRRDDFIKGSLENPWGEVIDELSTRVREHIGPAHELFVPRFSTTGPTERIVAEIVLLDAVQSYFEYVLYTVCGIPAITLEGSVEDWRELADRAQAFAGFDLEWWLTPLRPILQEFAAAARGEIRRPFWESIYKFGSFSGGAAVTGWITAFFPYLKDEQGNPTVRNSWLAEGGAKLKRLLAGEEDRRGFGPDGPSPGAFSGGLARAPFKWKYLEQTFDMEFLGGFVGVAQDPATLTLRPEIGWAIRQVVPA